jgi:DNA-binding MarR family transcriptional regulator
MPTRPENATAADQSGLTENLGWLLSQASYALLAESQVALAPLGLGSRGYCVLSTALGGPHTQTEIADLVGLDKTTMVVTVDELERQGLARRVASPTDRRARLVEVTPQGERAVEQGRAILDGLHSDVLAGLPGDEREAFMRVLTKLVSSRFADPVECSPPIRRREPRAT